MVIVSISDLLIDINIINMVKKRGHKPGKYNVVINGTFPLTDDRLDSILRAIVLPPIDIQKSKNGLYTILNGRHRVACNILQGKKDIEAVIH